MPINKEDVGESRVEILKFIKGYIDLNKVPPSRKEVSEAFGFNVNAVTYHYDVLQELGLIEIIPRISRGLHLTRRAKSLIK